MVKLVLTQIMKNEAHVAERMLNSIKSIVDGIVVIDTGSTDNSIEVVKKWGLDNGIETYVFERPFDDFEKSRNFSFEKAREIFLSRNDGFTYYNFWLDFDEVLIIDNSFNKNSLNKDLYMFNTKINNMSYTRNELCRLDKPFKFYGPIHEYITCDDKSITSGVAKGLSVFVRSDGGSWKSDLGDKYLSHAHVLEKYISKSRKDPRWIFYTAQSYHDSAVSNDKNENLERLRRSIKYYKERVSRIDGYIEEIFYSQWKIGDVMISMGEPWNLCLNELLKAYNIDPLRGESIKSIIDYYFKMGEWNNAYIFTTFAKSTFHNKNPYPKRLLFIDENLYNWKFLEAHSISSFYSGRKSESSENYKKLLELKKSNPNWFNDNDIKKIDNNAKYFL